jgi:hypothetical protein
MSCNCEYRASFLNIYFLGFITEEVANYDNFYQFVLLGFYLLSYRNILKNE